MKEETKEQTSYDTIKRDNRQRMVEMDGWWHTTERLIMNLSFAEFSQNAFLDHASYLIHDEYLEDTKRQGAIF